MEPLLFFHGGPGLNSNPEQQILTEIYRNKGIDFRVWNEPSSLRDTFDSNFSGTRLEQLLKSAETFLLQNYDGQPVCLMGHSFGGQIILWLLQKHSEKIKTVFMSAPCFNIPEADKNIFDLIQKDYEKYGDEINSKKMKDISSSYSGKYDDNMMNGWKVTLENPRLLDYYWSNKDCQQNYCSHFIPPEFSIDIESFLGIRRSFTQIEAFACDKQIIVFKSKKDFIISSEKENAFMTQYFSNLIIHNMNESSHYPHIEESEKVLDIIADEMCITG